MAINKTNKQNGFLVYRIQEAMKILGFPPGPVDGILGWKTETAIKNFQKANGLNNDGVVGDKTATKIADKLPPTASTELKAYWQPHATQLTVNKTNKNNHGFLIYRIQEALTYLGYNPGNIDGIIGEKTKAATKQFQTANGLDVDGVVGNDTAAKIGDRFAYTTANAELKAYWLAYAHTEPPADTGNGGSTGNNGNGGNTDTGNNGNGGNTDTGNNGNGGNTDTGNNGNGGNTDTGNNGNGGNTDTGNNGNGGNTDTVNNGNGGNTNTGNNGNTNTGNGGSTNTGNTTVKTQTVSDAKEETYKLLGIKIPKEFYKKPLFIVGTVIVIITIIVVVFSD